MAQRPFIDNCTDPAAQFTNFCYQRSVDPNFTRVLLLHEWENYHQVYPHLVDIVADVVGTCAPRLNLSNRSGITLLGFDFIIDRQLRPWLIEANFSPSMFRESVSASSVIKECVMQIPALALLPLMDGCAWSPVEGDWQLLSQHCHASSCRCDVSAQNQIDSGTLGRCLLCCDSCNGAEADDDALFNPFE